MKNLVFLLFIFVLSVNAQGQNAGSCFEVKYLDFFGVADWKTPQWPDEDMEKGVNMELGSKSKELRTSPIIPMILRQLQGNHPDCNREIDTEYVFKLIKMYNTIRGTKFNDSDASQLSNVIDKIRADYYEQVENVECMFKMNTNLMYSEPFYGEGFTGDHAKLEVIGSEKTDFGQVTMSKRKKKYVFTSYDKNGAVISSKVLAGDLEYKLTEVKWDDGKVYSTSYSQVAVLNTATKYSEKTLRVHYDHDGTFKFFCFG